MSIDYIKIICNSGGEVYIVGGAVRNYLYNTFHKTDIKIKDYDFLVRLVKQDDLAVMLQKIGIVKEIGQSFGIVLFKPYGSNEHIEFAIPRTEISTGPGYRDFITTANHLLSIEEDFSRRDATINAIAVRVYCIDDLKFSDNTEKFIDPFNGINDIKNKIWRSVGDPSKRFIEDPSRIMRAFRQSAELDLTIENTTMNAIKNDYTIMSTLIPRSYVRLYNEFFRMLATSNFEFNLKTMYDLGILEFLGMTNVQIVISDDLPFILRFAVLIKVEHIKICIQEWCNLKQIAATNYVTQLDINILTGIQQYYQYIVNCSSKYLMLKLIEKLYKLFKYECYSIIQNIIEYCVYTNKIQQNQESILLDFLKLAKNYPPSADQVVLNGNVLMSKWNLKGKQIKLAKELMLDMVFKDEATNQLDCLETIIENATL